MLCCEVSEQRRKFVSLDEIKADNCIPLYTKSRGRRDEKHCPLLH